MNGEIPALSVDDLSFVYSDGRKALEGVTFSVDARTSLGVVGPNGAGKTTLFLNLAGILGSRTGEIRLFDEPVPNERGRAPPIEFRRRIGIVFQVTDDQLFSPTVFDDVAFAPLNFGQPRDEIERRVATALAAVGLSGYEERTPQHLSAGEKRRVALATVLSYDPEILILDEPTSDLDPRGRRELVELLNSMPQTKLIASHDLEFVLGACDEILLLDGGKSCAQGSVEEILSNGPLLAEHGLEAPLGLRGLTAEEIRVLKSSGFTAPT